MYPYGVTSTPVRRREIETGKFVVLIVGDKLSTALGLQYALAVGLRGPVNVQPDEADRFDNTHGRVLLSNIIPPSPLVRTIVAF